MPSPAVDNVGGGGDHYMVLGVHRSASLSEVRQAFKKKALQLHPDKNPFAATGGGEGFKELNRAYAAVREEVESKQRDPSHRPPFPPQRPATACSGAAARRQSVLQEQLQALWEMHQKRWRASYGGAAPAMTQPKASPPSPRPQSSRLLNALRKEREQFFFKRPCSAQGAPPPPPPPPAPVSPPPPPDSPTPPAESSASGWDLPSDTAVQDMPDSLLEDLERDLQRKLKLVKQTRLLRSLSARNSGQ